MKIPIEKRPTCSCGEKMSLIKHVGYYDEFMFWCCFACSLDNELDKYEPDDKFKGAYA